MAQCKGCSQEITWDNEIRNTLGIRKPAELVDGQYVEHICPAYQNSSSGNTTADWKGKRTSNMSSTTYVSKVPNPNQYTGSSKDYTDKSKQQAQETIQTTTTTMIPTSVITAILETQKQILNEMEFLRSRFDDMYQTVNNTYLKQETMKTDISLLEQNIKSLLINKDDDPFVDTDPDYATEFNNRITTAVKKEE